MLTKFFVPCILLVMIIAFAAGGQAATARSFLDGTSRNRQLAVSGDAKILEAMTSRLPQNATDWEEVALYAKQNKSSFEEYLSLAAEQPAAFSHAVAQDDPAAIAAGLAILSSESESLAMLLAPVAGTPADLPASVESAKQLGKLASATRPAKPGIAVSIFAAGAVSGVVTGTTADEKPKTGSLGVAIEQPNVLWTGSINIASSVDTVTESYSEILLLPSTGSALQSGFFDWRYRLYNNSGPHAYLSVSKSDWQIATSDSTSVVSSASVIGVSLMYFYDILNTKVEENPVGLTFEAGLAYRGILGDVGQDDALRQLALGTDRKHFLGAEIAGQITWSIITASMSFYYFRADDDNEIPGFTNGQLAARFSVEAPFFKGTVKE